ncbi:hypothetical protein GGR52DRAFT_575359 [Hypoxylon sp. FL1284]|nr:hypothetical protein GGR52DRAFT_575359 [Hypoxylon sp. FL1284]
MSDSDAQANGKAADKPEASSGSSDKNKDKGVDRKEDKKEQVDAPKAPGVRCRPCFEKGTERWVFSGRDCPLCGTYAP